MTLVNFKEDFSLKEYNTFAFDVKTRYWATFENEEELTEIFQVCKNHKLQWRILGGGSNVIMTEDYPGVTIHPVGKSIVKEDRYVIADAGVVWDDFVKWTVEHNLSGAENLSYIPGSVGAAPVQNVGAYGVEAKDVIEWVEYYDIDDDIVLRIKRDDCEFGYRDSIFKKTLKSKAVVLRVAFCLVDNHDYNLNYGRLGDLVSSFGEPTLENIRKAVISIRQSKLPEPSILPNSGSFFKNPIITVEHAQKLEKKHPDMPKYELPHGTKIPAGWLIDKAGWKGYKEGSVGVHKDQALVLVNYGGATAEDILGLADKIVEDIQDKFAIKLEKEVVVW